MSLRRHLLPALLCAFCCSIAAAQSLPDGYRVNAELNKPLSSKDATVGEAIELKVLEPVVGKDRTEFIPSGAVLQGKVTHVVRSSADQKTGEISFRVERAIWKDHEMALNAYPVTMALPMLLKDVTPDNPQVQTGQIYNSPIAITASASSGLAKQVRKRAQDPSMGRNPNEDQGELTRAAQPLPSDWGIIRVDDPGIYTIIGSNERDISLPKGIRFVLKHLPGK